MKKGSDGCERAAGAQIRRLLKEGKAAEAISLAADTGFVVHEDHGRFEVYFNTSKKGRKK